MDESSEIKASADDVKEQLVGVKRELDNLQRQLKPVSDLLKELTGRETLAPKEVWGFGFGDQPKTEEPRNAIREIAWKLSDERDLSVAARAIVALMKQADGAFRDIRVIRLCLEQIRDSPQLTQEFKKRASSSIFSSRQ